MNALRVAVHGTGTVGARVARELSGSAEVGHVALRSGPRERRDRLAGAFGHKVEVDAVGPATVVVLCGPDEEQPALAASYLDEGSSVVSTAARGAAVEELLALDAPARERGLGVVVGAAFSPGLSTVLAAHGAALFDEVLEIHTASVGAAGPACVSARREAMRSDGREWRDGGWEPVRAGSSAELLWFPDPIGAVECRRGDLSEPLLLRRSQPAAVRLSSRSVAPPTSWTDRVARRRRATRAIEAPGAVRVEVRGLTEGRTDHVVYAAMDRPAVGAAATAAVAAIELAARGVSGAMGVAELVEPAAFLRELARRGVRCCAFEGIEA